MHDAMTANSKEQQASYELMRPFLMLVLTDACSVASGGEQSFQWSDVATVLAILGLRSTLRQAFLEQTRRNLQTRTAQHCLLCCAARDGVRRWIWLRPFACVDQQMRTAECAA